MRRADIVAAGEVGNGSGNLEYAVPGAGRQVELRRGLLEQLAARLVRLTTGVDFPRVEAGVGLGLAGRLPGQGGFDPRTHRGRGFPFSPFGKRFGGQGGHLDDQVDAVEEGAGKLAAIAVLIIEDGATECSLFFRGLEMVSLIAIGQSSAQLNWNLYRWTYGCFFERAEFYEEID